MESYDDVFPAYIDDQYSYHYHHNGSIDYFSYYSYSQYFYQFDFGFNHQDRQVIYIVGFFFILLLVIFGLLSNTFLLYGIVRFPRIRQDVQHIFITNMTIVCIMYLVLVGIPALFITGLEAFAHSVAFHVKTGNSMIYIQIFYQIIHTAVLFHLASMITALAFDQYLFVVYPVVARKWRTPRNAVIACINLWIVGMVVALLDGLTFINIFKGVSDTVMLIKDSLIFILFCLVPIILTIVFNMKVWHAMHSARTATVKDNHQANNARRFTQLGEENGGVPGALIRAQDLPNNLAIFWSFVVFWTLYHIVHLIISFTWALKRFDHWIYFNNKDGVMIIVGDIAVHFNVALNPLFYVLCNPKFRQHLYRVVYALTKGNSPYSGHIDETTIGTDE
ncbi:type-1 angiotensin II receptor A-like [Lytechinus variegatus]|uniref:type-1 angiotensin II receptor A-like n=1 Tax=Lytechinus variegatus TaxID=7654 RepID=UPI001BB23BE2|nr:type-1 angiotensin II receptor A-like [Lytechinus variegatus]